MTWVTLIGENATTAMQNEQWLSWVSEAYGVSLTVPGFGAFVLFAGAVSLFNWTESFRVPAIWLVLMTPLIATLLPVPMVWRLVGLITTALAALFVGLWLYWRRF
jgi:hypothetical protein